MIKILFTFAISYNTTAQNQDPKDFLTAVHSELTVFTDSAGVSFSTRREVVLHFCNTMLAQSPVDIDGTVYDLRTSAFLLTLCRHVADANNPDGGLTAGFSMVDNDYVTGVRDIQPFASADCDRNKTMQECSFAELTRDIRLEILNDMGMIKSAFIMGGDVADLDNTLNDFIENYFPLDENKNDCIAFISDNVTPRECYYPNTYDVARRVAIANSTRLLPQTIFLDWSQLSQDELFYNTMTLREDNHRPLFADRLFIENMVYNLFVSYYSFVLQNFELFTTKAAAQPEAERQKKIENEIYKLTLYSKILDETQEQLSKLLYQTNIAYTKHIGLVAFIEGLARTRKYFAAMHTPLNQLYYLLQAYQRLNV